MRRRGEAGSAALEVALSLPAIALVLLGLVQSWVVVQTSLTAQEAARVAARAVSATGSVAEGTLAARRVIGTSGHIRFSGARGRPGTLVEATVTLPTGVAFVTSVRRSAVGTIEPGVR